MPWKGGIFVTLLVLNLAGVDEKAKEDVFKYLKSKKYDRIIKKDIGFSPSQKDYVKGYLPENVWWKHSSTSRDEYLEIKTKLEELGVYNPIYFFTVAGSPLGDWLVGKAAEL